MFWSNTAGGYGASLDSFDDDETTAFMLPEDSEAVRHLIASFDNFVKSHRRAHGLTGAHVSRETRDQILEYRGSQERTPWPRQESGSPPRPSVNTCPTSSNQELLDLLRESEELGLSPPSHVQESSISLSPPPSLSSFSTSSASSSIQPLPRNTFSSKPESPDTRPPILAPTTALSIISSPVFAAAFDKIIRRDPGRTRDWEREFAPVGNIYATFQYFKRLGQERRSQGQEQGYDAAAALGELIARICR